MRFAPFFFLFECGISRFDRHSFVYQLGYFLGSYFFVVLLALGVS